MIEIPKHLRTRPVHGGYVVPYFVAWYVGKEMVDERTPGAKPDFRVTDMRRAVICRQRNMCWICGKQLGSFKWFAFGPSSAVGRISVEPPSHKDCAQYAVRVCPYMLTPGKEMRPVKDLRPSEFTYEDVELHHPGVIVLWATKTSTIQPVDPSRGIYYIVPGEPDVVEFWQAGRKATRAEIKAGIDLVFKNNPQADRNDRDVAWRVEHLMRYAPPEEEEEAA